MPTVKEIVINHLKAYGFDGLVNCEEGCGCEIDDLEPCLEINSYHCQAAYKHSPAPCNECDSKCDGYDEEGKNFCMRLEKPDNRE